jgi:hypothetical protein
VAKGSSESTAIPAASVSNRIDRLVLRLDRSQSGGTTWVKPVVITGTPSGSPQIPALQSSPTGQWDLPIARWTSASNGALSGLVDERQFMGGDLLTFPSGARPPATTVRVGIETDTRRLLWADGSAWNSLSQDTGFSTLLIVSPNVQNSVPLEIAVINGIAHLTGAIDIKTTPSVDKRIATLPAGSVPRKTIFVPVYQDGGTLLLSIAYASGVRSGQLWLTGNLPNAQNNVTLRFNTSWPVL